MSQTRHIFKVVVLSHNDSLFEGLQSLFGVEYEKSFTSTQGASFAFSHFVVGDNRLTAQFWLLDADPQWLSVRNLYMRGTSGIMLLLDPQDESAVSQSKRLLLEFKRINLNPVPIMIFSLGAAKKDQKQVDAFRNDIQRWSGYPIELLDLSHKSDDNLVKLEEFMTKVKDWRARNVIYQTVQVYFNMDAISNTTRSIKTLVKQLRKLFTAHYYQLLSDAEVELIVRDAVRIHGFAMDADTIIYTKKLRDSPWMLENEPELSKPNVSKR